VRERPVQRDKVRELAGVANLTGMAEVKEMEVMATKAETMIVLNSMFVESSSDAGMNSRLSIQVISWGPGTSLFMTIRDIFVILC
jgi:hypothetical protein